MACPYIGNQGAKTTLTFIVWEKYILFLFLFFKINLINKMLGEFFILYIFDKILVKISKQMFCTVVYDLKTL